MDRTAQFYCRPSYVQRGSGFPVYSGSRRQRGGSILGALKNFFMPILGNIGKTALRKGTQQAVGFVGDVAGDLFRGRNMKQSLVNHGKSRALNFAQGVGSAILNNRGNGNATNRKRPGNQPATNARQNKKRRKANF